jgi:hypothetical protein
MRRLVLFTVLAFALALPVAGLAVTSDDGTLSVRNGAGLVKLTFTGSAVGSVAQGKVVTTDPVLDDGAGVVFWGCNSKKTDFTATTTVCTGDKIRFRAIGGKYKLFVRGSGVYLSVVGRGAVTLDGSGDDPTVVRDGVYSLNDQPYRSLPNEAKTVELVAPAGG